MQQLYLLRHAEAGPWSPLGNDFSRPLSAGGKRHAQALSAWAADTLTRPDTVLCSPAKRTRETLAPLLAAWPQLLATTDYADSIYGASLDMLLTLAADAFSYTRRLLMVGHNPGLSHLLANVLRESDKAALGQMATGTLAVIGFEQAFKTSMPGGELLQLVEFKDLPA